MTELVNVLLMAVVFAIGASFADIARRNLWQHIGSAAVVAMLAGWLVPLLLGLIITGESLILVQGTFVWLISLPLARLIYRANLQQAVIIATFSATGFVVLAFWWYSVTNYGLAAQFDKQIKRTSP